MGTGRYRIASFALLFAPLLVGQARAAEESVAAYTVEMKAETEAELPAGVHRSENRTVITVSDNKSRLDSFLPGRADAVSSLIRDRDSGEVISAFHLDRTFSVMSAAEQEEGRKLMQQMVPLPPVVTGTRPELEWYDEYRTLAGERVQRATAVLATGEVEYWVARSDEWQQFAQRFADAIASQGGAAASMAFPDPASFGGFPLMFTIRWQMGPQVVRSVTEVVRIKNHQVDPAYFEVPAGYKAR